MKTYHKINGLYKRDDIGKFIMGDYSRPEFEYLKDSEWVFTEKVDGTNMRVIWKDGKFEFRGKTDNADFFPGVIQLMTELFDSNRVYELDPYFHNEFTIYGEAYGSGIQKGGGYNPNGKSFIMFDVLIGERWMPRTVVDDIADTLGIRSVPIVGLGTLQDGIDMVSGEGFQSKLGSVRAEGVVAEPSIILYNQYGERVITKLKTKDFS